MRPIELKLVQYFNLLHLLLSFVIFPVVVLTQHHGWLIGVVGYLGLVMGLSFLMEKVAKKFSYILLAPIFTLLVFYAFQLTFGVWITVLIWSILSGLIISLSAWNYYLNISNIQKHRTGIEVAFQFPLIAPKGIEEKKDIDYFDPNAFEIAFLETIIVPLSLEYVVQGKKYQQSFAYYWKAAPWESKATLTNYEQGLSGQSFLLQYHPNNPEELLDIVPQNHLSAFEAFIKENFKKNLVNNFLQLAFFLLIAVIFHFYW
ncbi:MAG: hypothetical protein ACRBFS_17705 [Aureispira sp.]